MFECCCFFFLKKSILIWTVLVILTFVFFFQGRLEYLVKWKGWAMKWVPWIHNVNVTQALVRFSWKMHINCALEQKWMHAFFFMLLHLCSGTALGSRRRTSWMTGWFWGLSKSECSCFMRSPACALSNQSWFLFMYLFFLSCFFLYFGSYLEKSKACLLSPPGPFTFLSCVLVLNYFQCLFL